MSSHTSRPDILRLIKQRPPARRQTKSGSLTISYCVQGSGPALLFCMGLGGSGDAWLPLASALARGRRTITYNNRDTGASSQCEEPYTVADMADDAVAILDRELVARTVVCGVSMGGMIAQELALRRPERVEKLVLMSTMPGIANSVLPSAEVLQALFPSTAVDEAAGRQQVRDSYSMMTGAGFAQSSPELLDLAVEFSMTHPPSEAGFNRQFQAILMFDAYNRLQDLNVPTLVMHGDEDRLISHQNGVLLAERIPQAELRMFEGAGHLLPLERFSEVCSALEEFISG